MRKLAGKKRRREDINIVDINEGEVVQQMDLERLKKTSEESAYKGSVSANDGTNICRLLLLHILCKYVCVVLECIILFRSVRCIRVFCTVCFIRMFLMCQGRGRGRGRGRGGVTALHKKKHQLTYLIHEVSTAAYLYSEFYSLPHITGQREGT